MAIIKQCCCGWTLRQGCYASATLSLIYFFLFTWITGSMTIGRLFPGQERYENGNESQPENMSVYVLEQQHVISRTSSVTAAPSHSRGNESSLGSNITKKIPLPSETSLQLEHDRENNSISMLRVFLYSEEFTIIQTVNLFLDLLCEVVGVYASILLIRGLQQEKKSWFWPWMIVVPTHIAIDAFTIFSILMDYIFNPIEAQLSMVVVTMIVDITLNSINAYGLICVISQYQEYNAGRGTAAYVEFSSQTPEIMVESATSAKTVLNKPMAVSGSHNRRKSTKDFSTFRSYNDKSDTYCEEFSLQTLATTNEKRKLSEGTNSHVNKAANNGKINNCLQVIVSDEGSNTQTVLKDNSSSCDCDAAIPHNPNLDRQNKGSVKYGKYLGFQNLTKDSNLKITNVQDYDCSPTSNVDRVNLMPSNGNGWHRDQNEISTNKSDSESEDADVLSAFGISSN